MVLVKQADEIKRLLKALPIKQRRIFSIVAHIDHGKSTTCDYLLARVGMLSHDLAGEKRITDSDPEEQQRIITIFTTVVNLLYNYEGKDYLIQLNDTPGHISFTGEVSRAIRASDGIILLIDAVEKIMTQTETNLYLALKERCKPVVYINKVDRLIAELGLTPKEVVTQIDSTIAGVNELIEKYAPEEFKKEWKVSFTDGSVAIGSAKDGWGLTFDTLRKKFKDPKAGLLKVFEKYKEGDIRWLRENLPLDEALLEMIIKHLPDPETAQKYKIPVIWQGDKDLDAYKAMLKVDPDGPLIGMITKIFVHHKTFRTTLIGRIWSGTLRKGQQLYLLSAGTVATPQRIGVMEITDILDVDEIPAGNMFAMTGFMVPAGEAFVEKGYADQIMELIEDGRFGFEPIPYASDPVVSRTIKPKSPQDIDKLGEAARLWTMADPTASFFLDKESGTYVLQGIDPLQIEILVKRIAKKVPIEVGEPIIVYRERVKKRGEEIWTKSPNGLNRIKLYIEPLEEEVAQAIREGKIKLAMDAKKRAMILRKEFGWPTDLSRRIIDITGTNMLIDNTTGVQRFERIRDYVIATFKDFVNGCVLAKEPAQNLKVVITDAFVHVDPAHTQMPQIFPMVFSGLAISFLTGEPTLYEPILRIDVKVPHTYMGSIITELQKKRGKVMDTIVTEDTTHIVAKIPAAETTDLAEILRSISSGRAFFGYQFYSWEEVPSSIRLDVIKSIRKRKGLSEEIPTVQNFARYLYVRQ